MSGFFETGSIQGGFKEDFPKKKIIHNGVYTKAFIKYNNDLVKNGYTDQIIYKKHGRDMIYNKSTGKFVYKHTYYTKAGKLRSKYNNKYNIVDNDTLLQPRVYVNKTFKPAITQARQSSGETRIPIDFPAINNDISFLLPSIPNVGETLYFIENNGTWFALNTTTIKKLREALKPGVVLETVWESGQEIIISMVENPNPVLVTRNPIIAPVIGGKFFKYTHKLVNNNQYVNLDKYGVFPTINSDNYKNNCLCESFRAAGHDITAIKNMVRNQEIPMRKLKEVAAKLKVYITVRRIEDKKNLKHYGDKSHTRLSLGLIDKHYFLIEKIPYTSYSIKNFFDLCNKDNWNKIICKEGKKYKRKNNQFITSYDAIKILLDKKDTHLKPIELCDELYETNEYTKVDEIFNDLNYNDTISGFYKGTFVEGGLKKNEYRDPIRTDGKTGQPCEECVDTYFFDFETTTKRSDGKDTIHTPYCVYTDQHKYGYFGQECGKKLLNDIINRHGMAIESLQDIEEENDTGTGFCSVPFVRLIAHNSGYDFRFLLKYLSQVDTIEKGNGLMTAKARYYYNGRVVIIEIKDSLKMINMPLGKFASAFGGDVKKEIMPYDLYTEENVEKVWIDIDTCLKEVKDKDKKEYLENCKRWNCIEDGKINILDYAGEYCYMDCLTLKHGYEKFANLVQEAIDEDINNYISLASLAHNYLVREGCYKDVLAMSGLPRAFIQKCVVGGRTMCANNKKSIHSARFEKDSHKKISDFDAVSLYPSAMNRMPGFLKGKPQVIADPSKFTGKGCDGFFVCIRVKKIQKRYSFPCVSLRTEKGIRNFTNKLEGEILYLDKVGLEDFVKYHGATYEIINGYFYNKGHNDKICNVMKYLFEQRLKYKKQKNPIQMVFKELMNSSYGKSYLKPIDSDSEYVAAKDFDKYMDRNYNYIKEAVKLANGRYYKVKTLKPIDTHYNNVHVGVEILSMSKRIMYEVMTLAEDLDISMYYTDTDSIHIDSDKIGLLSSEFGKIYNRELIGKQMGQFHTDFDMDGAVGEIHAVESIFLGKKCYIDKLEAKDKDGNKIYDYHIRMKGVPEDSIIYKAEKEYDGDVVALYKDLYDGKELTFNLLAVRPKFELCKNMTIISKKVFNRKIKFN